MPALVCNVNPKSPYAVSVLLPQLRWAQVHMTELGDSSIKQDSVLRKIKNHQQRLNAKSLTAHELARTEALRKAKEEHESKAEKGGENTTNVIPTTLSKTAEKKLPILNASVVPDVADEEHENNNGNTSSTVLLSDVILREKLAVDKAVRLSGVVTNVTQGGMFVSFTPQFAGRVQFRYL
eukprot:GSA25T00004284001.1